jgi:pilus assembly protein CpaF
LFAIIISEKGGAERRESFDKNEINVGRVQGNDLMLPKGNVSKHHARLLFRDGRFIVTDLKSTNGTYVNGRKIAQATIVREGDKIYIGDFVLRLEANDAVAESPEVTGGGEESIRTLARDPAAPLPPPALQPPPRAVAAIPAVTLKAPTYPPGVALPRPPPPNVSNAPSPVMTALGQPPAPGASRAPEPPAPVFSAEKVEESAPQPPKPRAVSNPPPPIGVPSSVGRPLTAPLNQVSPPAAGPRTPQAPAGMSLSPELKPVVSAPAAAPPPAVQPPTALSAPAAARTSPPPARTPPKETAAQAGRRLALMTLIDRIADAVDLAPLDASPNVPEALGQQIERVAREQALAMRKEGDAPEGVDLDAVARDAHREIVGLGALGPHLDDDDVVEVHLARFDQLVTVRAGGGAVAEPTAFSSEAALRRVVLRLAQQSGQPWAPGEAVVERRLPRAALLAFMPPAAPGHVVSVRKRRRVESTLDDLVRAGALSKPMAQFLEACLAARANLLVSGTTPLPVLSALAAAGATGRQRVAVVQDVEEIGVGSSNAASLALGADPRLGESSIGAAVKLRVERLIVTQLVGGAAAGTLDAIAEGTDGVVAGLTAPTLRQGINRVVAQVVLHRPGIPLEATREIVGDAFDVALEATSFPDGRLRVTRIAELAGADAKGVVARDLFVWNADAAGEGSHGATGVVPRLSADLAARGTKLDPAFFKRGR